MPPPNPFQTAVSVFLVAGCVAAWSFLGRRFWRREPILPHENPPPVPWSGWAVVLAVGILFVAQGICVDLARRWWGVTGEMTLENPDPAAFKAFVVGDMVGRLLMLVVMMAVAWKLWKVSPRQLGFDFSAAPWDLLVGMFAFLAIAWPIYALQDLLARLVVEYSHPLITLVQSQPDRSLLWLATLSAVLAAPVAEEFLFRGLLQGWLEKLEATLPKPLGFIPVGAAPILASSLIFALTHWGHGAAPIPLFLFSLVLGLLYQRTHRLLSPIVVHVLLNGVSMAVIWSTLHSS